MSELDALDRQLTSAFDGKVVRKDLLHRIKKGTNVPTFVLEFLLARFCASDDPAEIDAGMEAVLATLQDNYVRPDEANAAQSKVATKGKHRFIDKVHVRFVEKEKRHWASLENFNSQRIAVGEKFYRDNDRLLEGGIWAEVTLAHNAIEEDDYAFYIEDLRAIQLSRFDFEQYAEGLAAIGIEPEDANIAPAGATDAPTEKPAPDTTTENEAAPKTRTPREGTKQATLIAMLRAPDGATIEEIMAATGWQSHTVRGAMAGALKKKLGLEVTSEKVEDRGRVYKLPAA